MNIESDRQHFAPGVFLVERGRCGTRCRSQGTSCFGAFAELDDGPAERVWVSRGHYQPRGPIIDIKTRNQGIAERTSYINSPQES
jgi:hypothetical protein